ncbi:MAG: sensor histidine kinase [Sedimentibacter sp.]
MIIWSIIEIFVNFLQVFVIFKIYDLYYNRRLAWKNSVEWTIIIMAILLSVLNYTYPTGLNPYYYLSFIFLIYIVSLILFEGSFLSKAFTVLLIITILSVCELLAAVLVSITAGLDLKSIQEQNFGRFEVMIISQTVFVYLYLLLKQKSNKHKMILLDSKYYILVGTILFLTVVVILNVVWMYGNLKIDDINVNNILVVLTMCVSLISIVSIALSYRIIKDMSEKHKNDLELQQMKMEQSYYSDVNSVLEEIRILRHDMRGELAIIHGYNELNQKDKIRDHIEKKLNEMNIELLPQIDSERIITSFLNFKIKEAKLKNIPVEINTNIDKDDVILIDKNDLCRIINNVMNNAIEACLDSNEKYINLFINKIDDYIIVKCENPYEGILQTKGDKIQTIKKDKTKHGYGLKSIKSIAEKYNGFVYINPSNNIFQISAQIYNMHSEE